MTLNDLVPYMDIPKKYPHLFSEHNWKNKAANRDTNGLAIAFRKVGRNLYVNEKVLAECIDKQVA